MSEDDLPLQHVIRPTLPWREERLTECGRKPNTHAISRDEFLAKVRKQGKTRAAMTTCMTCFETAEKWPDWNTSPTSVLHRYTKDYYWWNEWAPPSALDNELRAIELLIAAHREEFDETLASLKNAVQLKQRKPTRLRLRGV